MVEGLSRSACALGIAAASTRGERFDTNGVPMRRLDDESLGLTLGRSVRLVVIEPQLDGDGAHVADVGLGIVV